jgi:hypothetical protein
MRRLAQREVADLKRAKVITEFFTTQFTEKKHETTEEAHFKDKGGTNGEKS